MFMHRLFSFYSPVSCLSTTHHHLMELGQKEQANPVEDRSRIRDLSSKDFTEFPEHLLETKGRNRIHSLLLNHNSIGFIPAVIESFSSLVILDISNNGLSHISEELGNLSNLHTFVAKNNCLDNDSLPKAFDLLHSLKAINLGGNSFTEFPPQLVHLQNVMELYLGSNEIREIPNTIQHMQK